MSYTGHVDRDVLIAIIAELQAVIARLEKRIVQLEGQASELAPDARPQTQCQSRPETRPAQRAPQAKAARLCMTPTRQVEHVVEHCPDCGTQLSGGWTHRTREVKLPQVPAEVTEHVYVARAPGVGVAVCPQPNWTAW